MGFGNGAGSVYDGVACALRGSWPSSGRGASDSSVAYGRGPVGVDAKGLHRYQYDGTCRYHIAEIVAGR